MSTQGDSRAQHLASKETVTQALWRQEFAVGLGSPRFTSLIRQSAHFQENMALAVGPCANDSLIVARRLGLRVSLHHLLDGRHSTETVGTGAPRRLWDSEMRIRTNYIPRYSKEQAESTGVNTRRSTPGHRELQRIFTFNPKFLSSGGLIVMGLDSCWEENSSLGPCCPA